MELLEEVMVLENYEFDNLVNEKIYGGDEVVECVADFEWSNYEDHLFEFNREIFIMEMKPDSFYRKYGVPEIKSKTCCSPHAYFTYMWEHDMIDKINYIVKVSW